MLLVITNAIKWIAMGSTDKQTGCPLRFPPNVEKTEKAKENTILFRLVL